MSKFSSIRSNFLYNAAYQLVSLLVPLATMPLISRALGAEGIGRYSYHYSIACYFVIFITLGLNNYGSREIARNNTNIVNLSKSFWSMYLFQLFNGALVNILYFIYCFSFSTDTHIALILGLYTISGALDINWFFFGIEDFRLITIRNIIIKLLTTIAIFCFTKTSDDIVTYTIIMSCGFFVSQAALWPNLLKIISFPHIKINDITSHIVPNCCLFLTVIAVSIYKIFAKIMLGVMTNETEVGYFEASERIIFVPTLLVSALGAVMLPRMSNIVTNGANKSFRIMEASIVFAMFLSSSMSFGIMGISHDFVPLFYGLGFAPCIQIFLLLLPSCLFLAFSSVIRTQYVLPNKLDSVYIKSVCWGALINIISNLIFIPLFQASGAALGTLIAEASVCIYVVWRLRHSIPIIKYFQLSLPFILSGLFMFVLLFSLEFNALGHLSQLLVKLIIGITSYFLFLSILFYCNTPFKKYITLLFKRCL